MTNSNDAINLKRQGQCAALLTIACAAALMMGSPVQAQTIYRVMGADGKITFSDQRPSSTANATATGKGGQTVGTLGSGGGGPALPFELNQVAGKFPVTLYSGSGCSPCDAGRAMLSARGIPFTEKTVSTQEDSEALKRISGETSLPFLTIGGQQIRGYSDMEWAQFLNAAGYPKSSTLPASYRNGVATPLVAVQKQTPTENTEAKPAQRAPAEPNRAPANNSSNPAGIKF